MSFVASFLAIDARATYGARVTADEPQYLLTAISLWEDADLDISDELAEQRFRPFHELDLNPQTLELDETGRRISPHDPLLPVLLAPATGLWGWVGAKMMLALIAATTAVATAWLAIRRFAVSVETATLIVGAAFISPPLTSYSTQLYPEMPAALAVIAGVGALSGMRSTRADAILLAAVIMLPWLAVKYVPVAVVLAAARLGPALRRGATSSDRRTDVALAGLLAAAGLLYLLAHKRVYGGWTVYATGDHFVDGEFQVIGSNPDYLGRTRRLVGLLVDRSFGLLAWTPAYLLLVPALVATTRRRNPVGLLACALVAVGWAMATWVALTMHGWWWPGRQLVVVLPLTVVAIAAFVDGRPGLRATALVGFGLGIASWLWLVAEASTGRRTLIVDLDETGNPWYQAWSMLLPDHLGHRLTGVDLILTVAWAAVLLASGLAVLRGGATSSPDADPERIDA